MKSAISWTDQVWEITKGCTRISAGCQNCYAERLTARFQENSALGPKYKGLLRDTVNGPVWNGTVRTDPDEISKPLQWRNPRKVFVCSRSDLFHEDVPFLFIKLAFGIMAATPRHTYQILTKRPERMAEFFRTITLSECIDAARSFIALRKIPTKNQDYDQLLSINSAQWPLPNVWLGTSVEHQRAADQRIPYLVTCPAKIRFVSVEPLLAPVSLAAWTAIGECPLCQGWGYPGEGPNPTRRCERQCRSAKTTDSPEWEDLRLHWLIIGAESGPNARAMEMEWALQLRDQAVAAGVAYYFKQQGGRSSNQNPWLVEADGRRVKWQQYPVNDQGALEVTGAPEEVPR